MKSKLFFYHRTLLGNTVIRCSEIDPETSKYKWAIVSGGEPRKKGDKQKSGLFGSGQGLWILTRKPVISDERYDEFLNMIEEMGIETSGLNRVVQVDF